LVQPGLRPPPLQKLAQGRPRHLRSHSHRAYLMRTRIQCNNNRM
jgi:hypothetical protein